MRLLIRNPSTLCTWSLALALLLSACGDPEQPKQKPLSKKEFNDKYKKYLPTVNEKVVKDEALQIDNYVKRHGLPVIKTATGLRYVIYEKSKQNGPLAKSGQIATVHFTCYLLNGNEVYTSRKGQPVQIVIDRDEVESGLHEGLKYLKAGDKAKFILPSHLAHGVVGDNDKIPPLTPVVYDIELISLK